MKKYSILNVQLQKGAYWFLYVSYAILISSNQELKINNEGILLWQITQKQQSVRKTLLSILPQRML